MNCLEKKKFNIINRIWFIPACFALIKFVFHLPLLPNYGFHHDELYFLACGNHFSFGYVDHPPLVPWLARLSLELFGHSLIGLRILALISVTSALIIVGITVWRMGGRKYAQGLTCLLMLFTPVYLRIANLFCITSFELLVWCLIFLVAVEIINKSKFYLWIILGILIGIGLLIKFSILFLIFGLLAGMIITPFRKYFKSPHFYTALAIAVVIFLPNLIWQIIHGWPTLMFMVNLNKYVMDDISRFQFILGQFLYINPFFSFMWIAGLIYLFYYRKKKYQIFSWTWISMLLLLLIAKSKIYYLSSSYPILFAGGGIAVVNWTVNRGKKWIYYIVAGFLFIGGILFAPISVPLLPISTLDKYVWIVTANKFENIYEVTGDLRGMFGWEERVYAVSEVIVYRKGIRKELLFLHWVMEMPEQLITSDQLMDSPKLIL
ncbi:MAG: glycosyltransferase family 39 protein [bacterium]